MAEIVGWGLVTVVALFGLQYWYGSYMTLRAKESYASTAGEEVAALRDRQQRQLASGSMPIDEAMRRLGTQSRDSLATIRPQPSTDPGPASGWMHHPDFEPIDEAPPPVPVEALEAPAPEETPDAPEAPEQPSAAPTMAATMAPVAPTMAPAATTMTATMAPAATAMTATMAPAATAMTATMAPAAPTMAPAAPSMAATTMAPAAPTMAPAPPTP